MRGDQPERLLVSPMAIHGSTSKPYHMYVKVEVERSELRGVRPFPAVPVLEADDVRQVVRRDLDDERVFDRGHAVNGSRPKAICISRRDLERLELTAELTELESCSPLLHEP